MQKKYLHLFIGLILIVLSLFYAFRGVSLNQLGNAFKAVNYFYLLPALLLVIASYLLRAIRWRYIIRSIKEVKTFSLVSPLIVGYMGNMLPARAGEFIRAYLLSKKENISFSSSFATLFIERVFDLFMVLLLLVLSLLLMPDSFVSGDLDVKYQLMEKVKIFGMMSLLLCVFIFLFSAFLQFKNDLAMKLVELFIRPLPQKWKNMIFDIINSFTDGLKIIRDKKGFLATIFLSVLIWMTFVLTYYPLYLAFGIEDSLPLLSSLVILCVTVAIFITVAPTPGFLGSYHLGCVAALHGIFGIPKAVALSYGIVAWLVYMGFTVVVGSVYAIKENLSLGDLSKDDDKLKSAHHSR